MSSRSERSEELTFEEAETQHRAGVLSRKEFDQYCYEWRNACFRFSTTGRWQARRHARANNLPLPVSDRPRWGDS